MNDELMYDVYDKYVDALDKLLEILKVTGVLDNADWSAPLYNLIYKYTNND